MMKHKIFLTLIVLMFTFGTMAMADYVDPTTTVTAGNTGAPVLVGTGTVNIAHKFGTWEGGDPTKGSTMIDKNYIINVLKNGSYAGDITNTKGGFAEKMVVNGATNFIQSDLLTQVIALSGNSFDQYSNIIKYSHNGTDKTAKAIEAFISGRYFSKIAITDNEDLPGNLNPAYSLDFQATSNGNNSFNPTTNIGLGDSCNLYPADIGVSIGGGGGCPVGSYVSYYKAPSFSGTLSGTNNTNTQTIVTCTKFTPSANPTNTGRCSTNPFSTNTYTVERLCRRVNMTTYTTFGNCSFQDTDMGGTGQCKFNLVIDKTKNSKNPKTHGYHWVFGGGCGTGGCQNGHYPTLNNVDPDTTGNISYVDSCNTTNSFWEWKSTDDYGQYMYWKPM